MICEKDGLFSIETAHTGYYIRVTNGLAEQLYYGARLAKASVDALCEKNAVGYGEDIVYQKPAAPLSLLHLCLELSPIGKGDFRAACVEIAMPHGGFTADFVYQSFAICKGNLPPQGLAAAYGGDETLCLFFKTPEGVAARLYYTVHEAANVITRRIEIENGAAAPITVRKCMSYQLDLPACDYTLSTFTGAWARERHETRRDICVGKACFGADTGASSNMCNPFFMLAAKDATEHCGEVYGFNLVYSGSHEGCVEVSSFGKTRVMAGVSSHMFGYTLQTNEVFTAPEAVLTYSNHGKNGMSAHLHDFVNWHIVRGEWAGKERPVLCNNWEATYFDFTEAKLLKMAKAAAKLGMELFVLDDGWFGTRDNDSRGLGDYAVNRKKLPGGLAGLCNKVKALGLSFGLWVEPEMVNEDSDLYRAHPDWVVQTPANVPCEGRHQLVLDVCRAEVQDYIIENVCAVLQSADIRYVKWDMNRHISDAYSPTLAEQGRFYYTYMRGLYRVLSEITARHPNVLFESCSSGGNRFDYGMLCYMPQIWTSDDTDAYERQTIQAGTSYAYPQSTMGCHVSASPNHQAARVSPIESRFNVAAFGVLGYELDLQLLSPAEEKAVAAQVAWYKAHRGLLQYGRFLRLANPCFDAKCEWMVVSDNQNEAILGEFLHLMVPNTAKPPLRFAGLCEKQEYRVTARSQVIDIRTFGSLINQILPVKVNTSGHLMHAAADFYMMPCESEQYTAGGDLLMHAGIRQKQAFTGTGYNDDVRLMPDFSSRMYYVAAIKP